MITQIILVMGIMILFKAKCILIMKAWIIPKDKQLKGEELKIFGIKKELEIPQKEEELF